MGGSSSGLHEIRHWNTLYLLIANWHSVRRVCSYLSQLQPFVCLVASTQTLAVQRQRYIMELQGEVLLAIVDVDQTPFSKENWELFGKESTREQDSAASVWR